MKKNDPIPESFSSIEEASEFWDSHDAGEYDEFLRPLSDELDVAENMPQSVLLEANLATRLKEIARLRGISLETLVNLWISKNCRADSLIQNSRLVVFYNKLLSQSPITVPH